MGLEKSGRKPEEQIVEKIIESANSHGTIGGFRDDLLKILGTEKEFDVETVKEGTVNAYLDGKGQGFGNQNLHFAPGFIDALFNGEFSKKDKDEDKKDDEKKEDEKKEDEEPKEELVKEGQLPPEEKDIYGFISKDTGIPIEDLKDEGKYRVELVSISDDNAEDDCPIARYKVYKKLDKTESDEEKKDEEKKDEEKKDEEKKDEEKKDEEKKDEEKKDEEKKDEEKKDEEKKDEEKKDEEKKDEEKKDEEKKDEEELPRYKRIFRRRKEEKKDEKKWIFGGLFSYDSTPVGEIKKEYDIDGNVVGEGYYDKKGKKTGVRKVLKTEYGVVYTHEITYKKGRPEGLFRKLGPSGELLQEGNLKDGVRVGERKCFDEGSPRVVTYNDEGKEISVREM